ncbi:MAG: [protein-PII] uridylyltransferase [Limisphaerales bacterium]
MFQPLAKTGGRPVALTHVIRWADKVAASAKARLEIPAGRLPCDFPDTFRRFLKVETRRIRILHRGGAGGREVCRARSDMMDAMFRRIFDAYIAGLKAGAGPDADDESLALVALGGYGRAELSPNSDVDLMLLHDRRAGAASPLVKALMSKFVPFLWAIGIECHPLVWDLDDCEREARTNMHSKTALLEARRVWGDARLFEQMRIVVRDRCVRGHEDEYVAARLKDQEARRAKWGHSYCRLEPNLKSGCGGIRDYQSLTWMARVKHEVGSLGDLVRLGKLSRSDAKQLDAAYDFLLQVRNEMHYQQDRRNDVLTRAMQPSVAWHLGYTDRSLARRVSGFMGVYYRHVRNLHLITRNLERRLAFQAPGRLQRLGRLLITGATPFRKAGVDGFKIGESELLANGPRIFKEQPRRLMRAFLVIQQRGLQLHPDLEDLIRQNLSLVDRAFLADPHVHETFLEIINQRGNVARILRAMHETGFLGKYIPAFHALTCKVQHEFFHLYTADEHTLVCLEMLDRIWDSAEPPFNEFLALFRSLDRPYVLYLALLLHDVGKADANQAHEIESTRVAASQTRRLRLQPSAASTVGFLVRHHLLMVRLSQKLDLDDPEVIRDFAAKVQTIEHLNLLTLHTFADTMGTSESLWTSFKDSLVWALHRRTEQWLSGTDEQRAVIEQQRKSLQAEVRRLVPKTFHAEEVEAHFANLPERYFLVHTPREISADIALAHRFMWNQIVLEDRALEPVVAWHADRDRGYSILKVCTWDRPRLFSRVAGALAAAHLNIFGARIFSRPDGPVFDTLFVNDPRTGRPPGREAREAFEEWLSRSLRGEPIDFAALIAARPQEGPIYRPAEFELVPTWIHFDNQIAPGRTVVEVQARDRVGLLYDLTRTFSRLGLEVDFARINTEKGAAVDTFHVRESGPMGGSMGGPVTDAARLAEVEARLRAVIEPG